ncbi:protein DETOXIFICATION 55-like [Phoenix dactylifera]|uniref:Protein DETOXIFICATION n=1 Tax=Phoenix dactylifera TaxID=42345 RepID=A0A8B8ZIR6_PHODC|nr:protein DETOXIFICATION 55-like [Phoenix dactylifera]
MQPPPPSLSFSLARARAHTRPENKRGCCSPAMSKERKKRMVAENQIQEYLTMAEVLEELKRMKAIGLPIIAINLVGYLKGMVSVVFMGRLGRLELAGGALAVGFTNITGYSVLAGLAMGMEPICSQAFGSRNLPLAARTLRRTILMLLAASVPIAMLWINLQAVMLALHQDPDVARVAARYCRFALPDLAANSLLHPVRIYLRSKGMPRPLMWCLSLAFALHVPLTAVLSSALGVAGVAIATFITNFDTIIFLLAYVTYAGIPDDPIYAPLPPLPTSAPSKPTAEWASLLRLALPSCLGVCLEWWWYELMTMASGYLSKPHVTLATSAIVIQTTSLMYTLPVTLSASVSARVGNELGAGRPRRARAAAAAAMGLAVFGSCLALLWTILGREAWGRVFTEDVEVLELTKTVLPVIGLCELANCPQTTGCGVLRGSARPAVGAVINLYSFYLVGAPVAIVLAFGLDWGFVGLCLGLLAAQVVCAISVTSVAFHTDWDSEASKALHLVGTGEVLLEGPKDMAQEESGILTQVFC